MLKKLVRRLGFVLVCLATLVALFYAEEDWRGKHAWDTYRHQLEARGERLDLASLAPPPVPDDQNFAMTPLLKPLYPFNKQYSDKLRDRLDFPGRDKKKVMPPLGNWLAGQSILTNFPEWQNYLGTTNLLEAFQPLAADLDEITAATQRPFGRFPIPYQQGIAAPFPHLSHLRGLARLYALRGCVELAAGDSDAAAADVQTLLRLAEHLRNEPLLISQLVRMAVFHIGIQPLWEGLQRHQWSDAQLAGFQQQLQSMDLVDGCRRALESEQEMYVDTVQQWVAKPEAIFFIGDIGLPAAGSRTQKFLGRSIPSGWFYQNLYRGCRAYHERLFPVIDPVAQRFYVKRATDMDAWLKAQRPSPYNLLSRIFLPALTKAVMKGAMAQTVADEAGLACALERYRLAHGQFPETLGALMPEFVAKLPHDVINGQPLHYQRTADGQFILYSVGWNEVDDGGRVLAAPSHVDLDQGDWVWKYPAPAVSTNP